MPIYEFYCPDCHVIFSFLSRRINTRKKPDCPRCGRSKISRKPSTFAISRQLEESDDDPLANMDEDRLEQAMASLASEAEGLDEDDPRQAARFMRRLYDAAGLEAGAGMEEALRRMESGEDPDEIEEELGDVLEEEDPFAGGSSGKSKIKALRRKYLPARVDPHLYDL